MDFYHFYYFTTEPSGVLLKSALFIQLVTLGNFLFSTSTVRTVCKLYFGYYALSLVKPLWIMIVSPSLVKTPKPDPPPHRTSIDVEIYEHTPLRFRYPVRLLRLKRARSGIVTCDLVEYPLQQCPPFEALSYSWDAETPDHPILCNGRKLLVTRNCHDALRRLRSTFFDRLLWVDSICIDQRQLPSSIQERNLQVSLMGQIYQKSWRVLVWLGEGTPECELAIRYLRLLLHVNLLQIVGLHGWAHARIVKRIRARKHYHVFWELVRRSWFTRMWTLQEIVLAADAEIVCGCETMDFDGMGVTLVPLLWDEVVREIYALSYQKILACVESRVEFRNLVHQGKPMPRGVGMRHPEIYSFKLTRLIRATRAFTASNPKDRAYGIFGLLQRFEISLPRPDYGQSRGKIYWEFIVRLIQHESSLLFLQFTSSWASKLLDAPTWVPDLSDGDSHLHNIAGTFTATKRCPSSYEISQDHRILSTFGKPVDDIFLYSGKMIWSPPAHVADGPLVGLEDGFKETIAALREWSVMIHARTVQRRYGGASDQEPEGEAKGITSDFFNTAAPRSVTDPVLDAFEKTLTREYSTVLHAKPYPYHLLGDPMIRLWFQILHGGVAMEGGFPSEKDYVPGSREMFFENASRRHLTEIPEWRILYALKTLAYTEELQHAISAMAQHSVFFITGTGYMGMGPPSCCAGDVVALLAGIDVPMILRRDGARYRVVGPAYVAGIMRGEAWDGDIDTRFELV